MGCPPVHGDNPPAFASGLSYVQVDKHGITILYHLHQCKHVFCAKVGKGGIKFFCALNGRWLENAECYNFEIPPKNQIYFCLISKHQKYEMCLRNTFSTF